MTLEEKIQQDIRRAKLKYIEDLEIQNRAVIETLRQDFGFGPKRLERFIQGCNKRSPEHLQREGLK